MKPTRDEAIAKLREDYGLSLDEVRQVLNMPLHPHSLRDDFAGQAMQGLVARAGTYDEVASLAYHLADQMLRTRVGGQKS